MKLGMKVKGLFSINICKISNLLILRTGKIAPNSPVLNLIFIKTKGITHEILKIFHPQVFIVPNLLNNKK